jgi:hypothetical protein
LFEVLASLVLTAAKHTLIYYFGVFATPQLGWYFGALYSLAAEQQKNRTLGCSPVLFLLDSWF